MASTNQDILAGGLFEDGSLFDDAPASMPPSERQPESDFNDGPGDFGGPGERREKVEKSVQYSPHSIHQVHLEVCPAEEAGELHRRRWSRCQDHQRRHTTPSPLGDLATHSEMLIWTLGCFSKDTLKKNEKPNPVRNWVGPGENISRRRG